MAPEPVDEEDLWSFTPKQQSRELPFPAFRKEAYERAKREGTIFRSALGSTKMEDREQKSQHWLANSRAQVGLPNQKDQKKAVGQQHAR